MRLDYLTIFPEYFDVLRLSLTGQGDRPGPGRGARPRPAHLDPRPAPDRRRHAVRRRRRHGDEAGALGRGVRRARHRRRHAGRPDARRAAVHPGAGPRPRRAAEAGVRLRALRGHRPAGARPRRHPGRGRRGVARRLRAQRRRGGRARGHRGGASGCCRASWATPSRSSRSRTRTACWSTPSTPGRPPGAASTCPPVLLSGDHAAIDAWRADQARRRTAERRPDLLHPSVGDGGVGDRAGHPRGRRRDPDPAAGLLGPGGAGQRHAATSRRCTSRSRRSRLAGRLGLLGRAGRGPARRRRPRPARGPLRRRRSGTSAGSWSRPTCRAAVSGGCCSSTSRRSRRPTATSYSLFTGARSDREPADVQEGGLPPAPRPAAAAGGGRADQDGLAGPEHACGRLVPRPSRPKDRRRHTPGIRVGLLPQGEPGAAGHHD